MFFSSLSEINQSIKKFPYSKKKKLEREEQINLKFNHGAFFLQEDMNQALLSAWHLAPLLPYNMTQSQILGIRTWTSLEGIIVLNTDVK